MCNTKAAVTDKLSRTLDLKHPFALKHLTQHLPPDILKTLCQIMGNSRLQPKYEALVSEPRTKQQTHLKHSFLPLLSLSVAWALLWSLLSAAPASPLSVHLIVTSH